MFSGKQNNREDDERIGKLLAKALGGSTVEGPCPTPEQIAALMDGTLKGDEKDAVMSHLAGCGSCREVFQTAAGLAGPERAASAGRARHSRHIGYLMPYVAAAAVILAVVSGVMVYKGRIAPSGQNVALNYAPAKAEKHLQEESSDKDMPEKAKARPEPAPQQKADNNGWDDAPQESLAMSEMPEPSYEAAPPPAGKMKQEIRTFSETPPPPLSKPVNPEQQTGRYDEYREGVPFSEMPADVDAEHEYDRPMDTRTLAEEKPRPTAGLKCQPSRECAPASKGGAGICRLPEEKKSTSEQDKVAAVPEKETAIANSGLAKAEPAEAPADETEPEVVKARGTILEIDIDKGEFVFAPEGSTEKIVIEADEPLVKGFKAGDKVMAQYEKGKVNVAIRLKKWRAISISVGC